MITTIFITQLFQAVQIKLNIQNTNSFNLVIIQTKWKVAQLHSFPCIQSPLTHLMVEVCGALNWSNGRFSFVKQLGFRLLWILLNCHSNQPASCLRRLCHSIYEDSSYASKHQCIGQKIREKYSKYEGKNNKVIVIQHGKSLQNLCYC